ncbi:SURF1 family protein [Actinotalea ferrariae]|nr:SURF1 family protein [Actinotalea ferrariae]
MTAPPSTPEPAALPRADDDAPVPGADDHAGTGGDPAEDRRRWALTVLVAVLVAAGCVAAGVWQWSRHAERSAAVAVVERNFAAPVGDLADLVEPGTPLPPDAVWRRAAVSGRYVGEPVLLRNRPVSGRPALHVLQPLLVQGGALDGAVLVVDRGWVRSGEDESTLLAPRAPQDPVEVVVRLRQEERSSGRDAPPGQVQEIVVEDVRAASGTPPEWPDGVALPLYGGLVTEDGAPAEGLGRLPAPATSLGTNLSYAFQWWVFALGALAAPLVLRRKERRDAAEAAEAAGVPASLGASADVVPVSRPAPRRRRRPTAEEEEDALLDAQTVRRQDP